MREPATSLLSMQKNPLEERLLFLSFWIDPHPLEFTSFLLSMRAPVPLTMRALTTHPLTTIIA